MLGENLVLEITQVLVARLLYFQQFAQTGAGIFGNVNEQESLSKISICWKLWVCI